MGELPRDLGSIPAWIVRAVQDSKPAAGLAILIGKASRVISSKGDSDVTQDLHALRNTFVELKFTVLNLLNPSKAQLVTVIKSVLDLQKCGIAWPPSWKRMVVAFSGAGPEIASDSSQDSHPVKIEQLVHELLNSDQDQLKCIPKIFLMDYNRGIGVDEGIKIATGASAAVRIGSMSYAPSSDGDLFQKKLASRGNSRIPSQGNYLLAFSTQPGMKSYSAEEGSYWIQTLSKFLRDEDLIDFDIENILKRVNIFLIKRMDSIRTPFMQQPEYTSTLNEEVKLLKEAKEMCSSQLQQLEDQLDSSLNFLENVSPQFMEDFLQLSVNDQVQHQGVMSQDTAGSMLPIYNGQVQNQGVMLQDSTYSTLPVYNGQVQNQGVMSHDLEYTMLPVCSDQVQYQGMLQEQSGQHPSELELNVRGAKAANNDLKDDSTASANSAKSSKGEKQSKTSKTILEEYFKNKSKGEVRVQYKTTLSSAGFTSTVFCKKVGYVKGDVRPTEKEAENSAASKALDQLKLIK